MSHWLRLGFPRRRWAAVLILLIAAVDLAGLGLWMAYPSAAMGPELHQLSAFTLLPILLCVVFAGLVATQRIRRYPTAGGGYAQWLASTPWEPERRLPFGPWFPVGPDGLVLAGLALLAGGHGFVFTRVNPMVAGSTTPTLTSGSLPRVIRRIARSPIRTSLASKIRRVSPPQAPAAAP